MRLFILCLGLVAITACGKNPNPNTNSKPDVKIRREEIKPKSSGVVIGEWMSVCLTQNQEKVRYLYSFKENNNYEKRKIIFNDDACELYSAMEFYDSGTFVTNTSSGPDVWIMTLTHTNGTKTKIPYQVLANFYFEGKEFQENEIPGLEINKLIPFGKVEPE